MVFLSQINEMCDIFIMCFVLFLFVTCFGWNFNAIVVVVVVEEEEEGEWREGGGGGLFGCNYD
jgi:hypothetical protein